MIAPLLVALALGAPDPAPPPAAAARVLTLDDAVRAARENAPPLRAARASADASGARSLQALSPLLPQVTGTGAWTRSTSNGVVLSPFLPATPESWDLSGRLSLQATATQTLVDLPAFARYGAARATARADEGGARNAEADAVLGARTAWFAARASKDLVGVARASFENQQAHSRQIEAFVQQGLRPPIDLAQARTDLANAKAQLVSRENGYATARVQLNQAMGVTATIDYDVVGDSFPPVEGEDRPLDQLLAEARGARPDVAAAEERVVAADRTLLAAHGGWFPRLGLQGSLSDAGPDARSLTWNATVGATLTWNLFQGGLTAGQVGEARANVEIARAQRDLLVQQLQADVDVARLDVRAAVALADANREAVVAARERLRLAEARYSSGAGSSLELSDAQVARTNAEAQAVQADFQLAQARARLLRALGRP
jgi:outer membrane protein